MLASLLKTLGCDKRWMLVPFCGHMQTHLVQHYFGMPSLGWEPFDLIGPFDSKQDAKTYANLVVSKITNSTPTTIDF
jgi:hypothetical protein